MKYNFFFKFLIGLLVINFEYDPLLAQNYQKIIKAADDHFLTQSETLYRRRGSANYIFIKANHSNNEMNGKSDERFVRSGNRMIMNYIADDFRTTTVSSEFKISKPKPWRKDDTEAIKANLEAEQPVDFRVSHNLGKLPATPTKIRNSSQKSLKNRSFKKIVKVENRGDHFK